MYLDTTPFRIKYNVDEEGKYARYTKGKCEVCGWVTDKVDASLLWDGLVTRLCCDECYDKYWGTISEKCSY